MLRPDITPAYFHGLQSGWLPDRYGLRVTRIDEGRLDGELSRGHFLSPFVYRIEHKSKTRCIREEVFGPHVALIPFGDEQPDVVVGDDIAGDARLPARRGRARDREAGHPATAADAPGPVHGGRASDVTKASYVVAPQLTERLAIDRRGPSLVPSPQRAGAWRHRTAARLDAVVELVIERDAHQRETVDHLVARARGDVGCAREHRRRRQSSPWQSHARP